MGEIVVRWPMPRPFATLLELPEEPDWRPLVAVARLSRESEALPSIDERDFMYMAAVVRPSCSLRIHLYKHRDTRHYLNLDDCGHAYQYRGAVPGKQLDDNSGGRYRLHQSLGAALLTVLA